MSHEDILYRKYIKTSFLISNMLCQELYLGNFKSDFLLHLQIPDFQIVVSPNKPHTNGKLIIQLSD